jgi:hypothetical protein
MSRMNGKKSIGFKSGDLTGHGLGPIIVNLDL